MQTTIDQFNKIRWHDSGLLGVSFYRVESEEQVKGGSAHKIKHDFQSRWPVWQPGFHDRWMRNAIEYRSRLRYIAENPVSAKLVERAEEYAFSFANAGFKMDISQFEERTSGAEAHLSQHANVAAEAATHKTHAAAT